MQASCCGAAWCVDVLLHAGFGSGAGAMRKDLFCALLDMVYQNMLSPWYLQGNISAGIASTCVT